ncbi:MAG: hypothetical protein ACKOIZ_13805, partial [Actinomycetota bacterium]
FHPCAWSAPRTRCLRAACDRSIGCNHRASDYLEFVVEPSLSILVVRRLGWSPDDYTQWSDRMLHEGIAFVVPTTHKGETVLRCVW